MSEAVAKNASVKRFCPPRLMIFVVVSLSLLCNSRIFVTDISYSYLYWHDLYPAVSDIYFMISLYAYFMLCMIRQLALVHRYPFQYSNVCSSMMSVHPKDVALSHSL